MFQIFAKKSCLAFSGLIFSLTSNAYCPNSEDLRLNENYNYVAITDQGEWTQKNSLEKFNSAANSFITLRFVYALSPEAQNKFNEILCIYNINDSYVFLKSPRNKKYALSNENQTSTSFWVESERRNKLNLCVTFTAPKRCHFYEL
ncbi:DUF3757 domain-containing protein [Fluviispira multicolorata]|uniref:DUF3757 domain-containing protein n=1 Tax=Fluviispira multicolorata TaxID=2654512 RepID=A0A833N4W7_9BACT|nr:DUF3757 domain-containing protein [Fluviispira multicolorata]KAB8033277.1 DUF3757 domain-containing protein [Fluviispira multicolorata]